MRLRISWLSSEQASDCAISDMASARRLSSNAAADRQVGNGGEQEETDRQDLKFRDHGDSDGFYGEVPLKSTALAWRTAGRPLRSGTLGLGPAEKALDGLQ
jgi:hypothetical protein